MDDAADDVSVDQPPGAVSCRDAVVQPWRRASPWGDATNAIRDAEAKLGLPSTLVGAFQGNAQAFQDSLASEPYLVAAALIAVYIILGVLYESYVHPLTILSTLRRGRRRPADVEDYFILIFR